jgi:hypothetical protein
MERQTFHGMTSYRGVDVQANSFLTLVVDGLIWRSGRFTPGKERAVE